MLHCDKMLSPLTSGMQLDFGLLDIAVLMVCTVGEDAAHSFSLIRLTLTAYGFFTFFGQQTIVISEYQTTGMNNKALLLVLIRFWKS